MKAFFKKSAAFILLCICLGGFFSTAYAQSSSSDSDQSQETAGVELYIGDIASRNQLFMILGVLLVFMIYSSVRFNFVKKQISDLSRSVQEFDDTSESSKYEKLNWSGVFHSCEDELPILPGLSFSEPEYILIGCHGSGKVPNLKELKSDLRVNLLLNIIHTVLQEPEQNAVLVSRRLGIKHAGWGLLSLEADCDFNSLSDSEKAEFLENPKLKGWENALLCFNGWDMQLGNLYRTCRSIHEKGAEATLIFDGMECVSDLSENGLQSLSQKLLCLSRRTHSGVIIVSDTDSEIWKQRRMWAQNWAEVSLSEKNSEIKVSGSWNKLDGTSSPISAAFNISSGSGRLK